MPILMGCAQGNCEACSSFNDIQQGLFFYAIWNASNGTRWWPQSLDPPHLPPRPTTAGDERRAGLCWPCPQGTLTLAGDAELCRAAGMATVVSSVVVNEDYAVQGLPSTGSWLQIRRKLLAVAERVVICPSFASGAPLCACNPGFERRPDGGCALAQACSSRRTLFSVHAGGKSLLAVAPQQATRCPAHAWQDEHGHCRRRPAGAPEQHLPSTCCGPGQQRAVGGGCMACPVGKFSRHIGHAPCLDCPPSMTTRSEGSLSRTQCLVPLEADTPFPLMIK